MKTKFYALFIITLMVICNSSLCAQTNIFPSTGAAGIGTTTPDASSLLEITSTRKGLLIPRMTKNQRDAIASPATGLMIYQTNSAPGFYYYDGAAWKAVIQKSNGWLLTGNAGTVPGTNFIGTTDAEPLMFKVNNNKAGYIDYDDAKANTGFGYQTLYANTSGYKNTANGYQALYSNSVGYLNVATGYKCFYRNTTGNYNTAAGSYALYTNTSGNYNTAAGFQALYSNTSDYNTANGYNALSANTTGMSNEANGAYSLYKNYTGYDNTANGTGSLYANTQGFFNTADGYYALQKNTTGDGNTALGNSAGSNVTTGSSNIFIGSFADCGSTGALTNSTAIGASAKVTVSNAVRIGSNLVTSIGGYANWSNISDGRVKKNIKENVPGLVFINKLKPITYNLDLDAADNILQIPEIKDKNGNVLNAPTERELNDRKSKEQIIYTGFIAQDVEKTAKSLNYDFSGVDAAKNDKDLYGLRYAEFVVPLVKAVQELSKMNDTKDASIDSLKSEIGNLKSEMAELKAMIISSQSTVNGQQSTVISSVSIQQNIPNPFNHTTMINYTLPQTYSSAKIVVTDKSGKVLKEVSISAKEKGSLQFDASTLSSGAYQYSLYVDGKLIDTKQMVLTK